VALLVVLCVAAVEARTVLDVKQQLKARIRGEKPSGFRNLPKQNCKKGWLEVNDGKCCPKDHPYLVQGDCYAECDDSSDEFNLGAYVGCRARCPPGYASTTNTCSRDPVSHQREDTPRALVRPEVQLAPKPDTDTTCRKGYVKVSYLKDGKGGCCPKDSPILIGSLCYPTCPANQDAVMIADFVGCRAHCPAGYAKEDSNFCNKDEDTIEREDFPRAPTQPEPRRKSKKRSDEVADGCQDSWVAASDSRCCPAAKPILRGLLCYEVCSDGYVESHFGCRRICPDGWHSFAHTCTSPRGGKTIMRMGYEREPSPSASRKKDEADPSMSGVKPVGSF